MAGKVRFRHRPVNKHGTVARSHCNSAGNQRKEWISWNLPFPLYSMRCCCSSAC
jgi:hypothetical protein